MSSVVYSDRNFDTSVLEDDFDGEPLENSSSSFGDFELVGHGEVTSKYCGNSVSYRGCLRTELHDRVLSDGTDCKGKVYVRRVLFSCGKPSCPVCFKRGWSPREAHNIEYRLGIASKHWGLVEHIVVSVPLTDYHLSYETLRKKAGNVLFSRGVVGGCLIFHGFRYNGLGKYWYWSPHFHTLGFILGGYGKCRGCRVGDCFVCSGFEGRVRRLREKDGYVIKVLEKRNMAFKKNLRMGEKEKANVFGTAVYQLGHASVKKNSVRFHVVTWFGVCSYRKLKVTRELRESICPICHHDLIRVRYNGNPFVVNWVLRGGMREFLDSVVDGSGVPNWVADGGDYG